MHSLLVVALFPFFSILLHNTVVDAFGVENNVNHLSDFNIFCTNDNCSDNKEDSLSSRACHCGMQCAQLDTCCFDTPYAVVPELEPKPTCRYVHNSGYYFLVDQCPSTDSVWSGLCNGELSEEDNLEKLVPVTSLLTNITYKNYYCYKCNEASDAFVFWKLEVHSSQDLSTISKNGSEEISGNISFAYNNTGDTIMAFYDGEIGYFSVNSSLTFPKRIRNVTHICEPNVVSTCSDEWPDDEIRNKCLSYMYLKKVVARDGTTTKYKNIHCALCNYENLTDVYCTKVRRYGYDGGNGGGHIGRDGGGHGGGYGVGHRGGFTGTKVSIFDILLDMNMNMGDVVLMRKFSYAYILDFNRSDGELVGKIQILKCTNDHIWDPFFKKCRKFACALPGFKRKNGKCVKE